jgi:flagellar hook protein FlgE
MGFAASLSGLTGASTAIEIIGNNISNLETIGFKTSKARFADVLAAAVPGGPPASVASAGVSVEIIRQNDQGIIAQSDNPLDMAISGLGFFRLDKDGAITYSRDGRFQLGFDATNPNTRYLVNGTGSVVMGYPADYASDPQGVIVTTAAPQDISFSAVMPASATTTTSIGANLGASAVPPPVTPFAADDPASYNSTTRTTVYDSAGASHDLRMYFVKSTTDNRWSVITAFDGTIQGGSVELNFDSDGKLTTTMPLAAQTYALTGGGNLPIALDFSGTTQYGNLFSVDAITQDGWRQGVIDSLSGFTVGNDGVVNAVYSNGKSRNIAQLVLANFVNPDAMIGVGDSQWKANADPVKGSGKEILDVPGRGAAGVGLGSILGGAKEQSNVDLNIELIALIEQQRNYQASAQTFKILDQVMQNLKDLGK